MPLVVGLIVAAAGAVWYERNTYAIQDALDVLLDSVERGDQPWDFLPAVYEAYIKESYKRQVLPTFDDAYKGAVISAQRLDPLVIDLEGDGTKPSEYLAWCCSTTTVMEFELEQAGSNQTMDGLSWIETATAE